MVNNELLTRHKKIRNAYLQSISNSELEARDIISNFHVTDENHITKLFCIKNSISDKLRKVRELDDTVISVLEQQELDLNKNWELIYYCEDRALYK